ncbi:MAG: hypothetical protein PHH54_00190 [Candidatus Nanoarchaeia archaeon]|nr:hypothetical protein [Candidatus Nanoarchaeia archaeon]MDD5740381.1 hypothetical protein [Candidatus Nanoarchaeia archaeon]
MITETKEKLELETELTQRFEIPLNLENGILTAYGTYELNKNTQRGSGKRLKIEIPDFDGRLGLYAEFLDYGNINRHSASVKSSKDYSNNPKLEKFFKESIKPILEKSLPAYMLRLMRFDK